LPWRGIVSRRVLSYSQVDVMVALDSAAAAADAAAAVSEVTVAVARGVDTAEASAEAVRVVCEWGAAGDVLAQVRRQRSGGIPCQCVCMPFGSAFFKNARHRRSGGIPYQCVCMPFGL
jgi:hypothetical protein